MGWLEKSDIKLISTQVVVEVEVGVELDNFNPLYYTLHTLPDAEQSGAEHCLYRDQNTS